MGVAAVAELKTCKTQVKPFISKGFSFLKLAPHKKFRFANPSGNLTKFTLVLHLLSFSRGRRLKDTG
jgi:hypothetical protein